MKERSESDVALKALELYVKWRADPDLVKARFVYAGLKGNAPQLSEIEEAALFHAREHLDQWALELQHTGLIGLKTLFHAPWEVLRAYLLSPMCQDPNGRLWGVKPDVCTAASLDNPSRATFVNLSRYHIQFAAAYAKHFGMLDKWICSLDEHSEEGVPRVCQGGSAEMQALTSKFIEDNIQIIPPHVCFKLYQALDHLSYGPFSTVFLKLSVLNFCRYLRHSDWLVPTEVLEAYGDAHPECRPLLFRFAQYRCISLLPDVVALASKWGQTFKLSHMHLKRFQVRTIKFGYEFQKETIKNFLTEWAALFPASPPPPTFLKRIHCDDETLVWCATHYPEAYVQWVLKENLSSSRAHLFSNLFEKTLLLVPKTHDGNETLRSMFWSFGHARFEHVPTNRTGQLYTNFQALVAEFGRRKLDVPPATFGDTRLCALLGVPFADEEVESAIHKNIHAVSNPELWSEDFRYLYNLSKTSKHKNLAWFSKIRALGL